MPGPAGRPRDPAIDAAVLEAARQQLATHGYEAMSLVAVAEQAGTTRQALYRRWPTKAALAVAAIASLADRLQPPGSDDPYTDLVAEMEAFAAGVSRPNGISLVGTMLQDSAEPELRERYREVVVRPRRARLRAIFERAAAAGLLDSEQEGGVGFDLAAAACTGTRYAVHLAGAPAGRRWAEQTAALVWRGLGGTVPEG